MKNTLHISAAILFLLGAFFLGVTNSDRAYADDLSDAMASAGNAASEQAMGAASEASGNATQAALDAANAVGNAQETLSALGLGAPAHSTTAGIDRNDPEVQWIETVGSKDVVMTEIDKKTVVISIKGSGDVVVAGQCQLLLIDTMGSGDIDAKNLHSGDVKISSMGSGDSMVRAAGSLEINIMGSGDVVYFGTPEKIAKRVAGTGSVVRGSD